MANCYSWMLESPLKMIIVRRGEKMVLYGRIINCLLNHRHIIAEFCILQKSISHGWIKFVKYLLSFINPSQIASLKIGMFRKVTN